MFEEVAQYFPAEAEVDDDDCSVENGDVSVMEHTYYTCNGGGDESYQD